MLFTWECKGEQAMFLIHVDDIVVSHSGVWIKEEFGRLIRNEFGSNRITGGDCELTYVSGISILRDRVKQTITLSEAHFVKKMLDDFDLDYNSVRPVSTPLPTGIKLQPWEGQPVPKDAFDY